jgi:hypothetical protein
MAGRLGMRLLTHKDNRPSTKRGTRPSTAGLLPSENREQIRTTRLCERCNSSEDKVDPGEALLTVVVLRELGGHLAHKRIVGRGALRHPLCGDSRQEGRAIRLV